MAGRFADDNRSSDAGVLKGLGVAAAATRGLPILHDIIKAIALGIRLEDRLNNISHDDLGSTPDINWDAMDQATDSMYDECANEGQSAILDLHMQDFPELAAQKHVDQLAEQMPADEWTATQEIWDAGQQTYFDIVDEIADEGYSGQE